MHFLIGCLVLMGIICIIGSPIFWRGLFLIIAGILSLLFFAVLGCAIVTIIGTMFTMFSAPVGPVVGFGLLLGLCYLVRIAVQRRYSLKLHIAD